MAALSQPGRTVREEAPSRPAGRGWVLYLGLFAGAAAISGFTILRGGAPFDEGLVLQAARRVADGQVPYRDFLWPYGPAQPYLFGASFEAFGTSLLWWRVLRVACDAAVATLVFLLVRRWAPRLPALTGWLAAACAMAQPTSATPFPPALALGLAALALATREDLRGRDVAVAGLLCGMAAAWRLDFGIYAGGAVLVGLALRPGAAGARVRRAGAFTAVGIAAAVLAYLPFVLAVGPAHLYDALVGSSLREREFWTLPFPLNYDGGLSAWPPGAFAEDAKDVLGYYLPLLALAGVALVVAGLFAGLRGRGERAPQVPRWTMAALLVFVAGGVLYLLSRTDEFHTTPLVVLLAATLPLAFAARPPRAVAAGLAVVLALLVVHGLTNRVSALLLPPDLETLDVAVADGAKAPPAEAEALERMVATVRREVPPEEPIYAITRRSDLVRFNQPLIYVLTERDNPTDRDFGLQTSEAAQRRTVATLERARPGAVVRWTDPISIVREPNLRGRPSGSRVLDRWVRANYRLLSRSAPYEVLVPRRRGAAHEPDRQARGERAPAGQQARLGAQR